jgi:hypothetical protein
MHPLQEKFQITVPAKEEAEEPWVSFESSRDLHNVPEWCSVAINDVDGSKFNQLPPGMDISNQMRKQITGMPMTMAGETDVSKDVNPGAFAKGFTKREMKGTDDQYTGEHVDHFYGDAGGFVERNNYLDRE